MEAEQNPVAEERVLLPISEQIAEINAQAARYRFLKSGDFRMAFWMSLIQVPSAMWDAAIDTEMADKLLRR